MEACWFRSKTVRRQALSAKLSLQAPRPWQFRCFMRTSTRSTNGAWPHCSRNSRRKFRFHVRPRLRPRFASTNERRPIANAYVMPLVASYLEELERRVREMGISGSFYVMLSSGGIATCETAKRFPVRLIESGPAAGVVAAARFAHLAGENRLLSFDMGGTTAKACIIDGGEPLVAHEFEVARAARFK